MTTTIPLVIYTSDQRVVIGSIEIKGRQLHGEIHNEDIAHFFGGRGSLGEFSLVAEPAKERLNRMILIVDERIPPGEIRFVTTLEDLRTNDIRFETNRVKLLLEKKATLTAPEEKETNG